MNRFMYDVLASFQIDIFNIQTTIQHAIMTALGSKISVFKVSCHERLKRLFQKLNSISTFLLEMTVFPLCHAENKLIFQEMMIMFVWYKANSDFDSASSLNNIRHVASFIYTLFLPLLRPNQSLMLILDLVFI
jgi:hypothetical protein